MAEQDHGDDARFRPLRPAAGARLVAAIVVGPLAWIVAIMITGLVVKRTDAIELGLLVTVVCFVAAAGVLSLLRAGRRREERRYAARS